MKTSRTFILGVLGALGSFVNAGAQDTLPSADLPAGMQLAALPLRAPEPADNPGTAGKVALGRLLFFDPILSATRDVACATCHHPRFGWADARATPIGVDGAGLGPHRVIRHPTTVPVLARNTPTIVNTAFNGLVSGVPFDPAASPMFWDARVAGLEGQVLMPMRSREEMRGDAGAEGDAIERVVQAVRGVDGYRERFAAVFGRGAEDVVTAGNLARAIAAFERSLVATNAPFDRFQRGDPGALTAEARQGQRVFQEAGCILCHGGPMFSDFRQHFIGVPDTTPNGGGEVRTPTLRNLARTAPYMHNGSLRTLEDVLKFYEQLSDRVSESLDGGDTTAPTPLDPLLQRMNLNVEDFPALEAFLAALNDDDYDKSVPAKVPSGLPVGGNLRAP